MYSYKELLRDMRALGIGRDDVLLVHSSMKAIGEVEGGAETVLDVLQEAVGEGMLVLPTHTWATMGEEHSLYDPETEPACVGILPNLFLKRSGVHRSLHPTHSVAAWSANEERAVQYISGEEKQTTPCSRTGCYGKLYDLDAKILLLGVDLNRNTYMHGVEEWFGIRERLTDFTLPLAIKMPDGRIQAAPVHKHFKPNNISISEYYIKMKPIFKSTDAMQSGTIGDASCYLLSARKTADITTEYLKKERDIFTY